MKGRKIPQLYRNVQDSSITLTYAKPTYSLIWLHGMCDNADGFLSFFSHSHSPLYHGARIKLIEAPLRNITVNGGNVCNAWYDMMTFKRFTQKQENVFNFEDISQSMGIVKEHVQDQARQWHRQQPNAPVSPFHRIYVGGFSQGGVMALHYCLQAKNIPAGAICMSGYILKATALDNLGKLPIMLMHGKKDPQVRELEAKKSFEQILRDQNLVEYRSYDDLEHSVNLQQLDHLKDWFNTTNTMIERSYKKK